MSQQARNYGRCRGWVRPLQKCVGHSLKILGPPPQTLRRPSVPSLLRACVRRPHQLLHNSVSAGHLTQCDSFGICYILSNQQVFLKYVMFSLLTKCIRGPYFGDPAVSKWWRAIAENHKRVANHSVPNKPPHCQNSGSSYASIPQALTSPPLTHFKFWGVCAAWWARVRCWSIDRTRNSRRGLATLLLRRRPWQSGCTVDNTTAHLASNSAWKHSPAGGGSENSTNWNCGQKITRLGRNNKVQRNDAEATATNHGSRNRVT